MNSFPADADAAELVKAVLVVAAGDGDISATEREFLVGYLHTVGVPQEVIALAGTYAGKDKIEDLKISPALSDSAKHVILYTAVLVAGSDGLADAEVAALVKIGAKIGLPESETQKVVAQYKKDLESNKARVAILFPVAHPWK